MAMRSTTARWPPAGEARPDGAPQQKTDQGARSDRWRAAKGPMTARRSLSRDGGGVGDNKVLPVMVPLTGTPPVHGLAAR